MLQDSVSTSQLTLSASSLLIAYAFFSIVLLPLITPHSKYVNSQTWVGIKKQWFARYRAGFETLKNTRGMVMEGTEYLKKGQSFVLPQFSSEPLVILPASKLQEVMSLRDDQIDHQTINNESIAQVHTIGPFGEGPHIDIVRRQLTRKLPTLTTDVYDELVQAMHNEWPATKDEFVSVKAYDTCMKIVSRAANRVFCGTNLCRTPEFLEATRLYAVAVFKTGGIMRLFPKWMHPIVAPILKRDVDKYRDICKRIALPEIHARLKHLQSSSKDLNYTEPNDALQWLLRDSVQLAKTDPHELDDEVIVRRLLVLNMVAIHTTSMVTTNTLLDIYGSSESATFIAGLREECERVLAEYDGVWTKDAVNKLVRVDSAIRETMRISSLGDLNLKRVIKDPKGITLSDGQHIPAGVRIAWATHDVHQDPTTYPERPTEFDAFRFSRPREEYLERVQAGEDAERLHKVLEQKNTALIAVGNDWLSFGHGRHACPGRFFASQEMKLMLAHIVMNYEIKVDGGRPPNMLINGSSIPSQEAELQVRLRQ
ncbi:putative cytochrome P450 [Septoria linicola]|nr:putative cytochrome P450 [Septoria linicola]